MTILLIGGHGRTGRCVLEHGSPKHRIDVFEGDVLDAAAIRAAMRDVDAVVSVVGHVKGSTDDVQTVGMANIVEAMEYHGIVRVVSLTGTGVRAPGDKVTLIDRVLNLAVSIIDPARVRDGIAHARVLESSGLNYTVLRVLKLTNGQLSNHLGLSAHGPAKTFVSRRDVAAAILRVLEDGSYIKGMPIISR